MASRGARARKVTEKVIEKSEKKNVDNARAERFARMHSPVGSVNNGVRPFSPGAGKTPFSPVSEKAPSAPWVKALSPIHSSNASVTSSGSNGSGFSSMMSSKMSADERKKYVAKGKATAAPRGRGGGVPQKISTFGETRSKTSFTSSSEQRSRPSRSHSITSSSGRHSPVSTERTWNNTRIYSGGGQPPRPYSGFEHDEDMWMADGDCLIFFSEETNEDDPHPMLRVHTGILEQAKSTFMINLLRYGEIVPEEDDTPPSSAGPTPASHWPLTPTSLGNLDQLLQDNSQSKSPRLPETPRYNNRDTWSTSDQTIWSPGEKDRPRTAKMPVGDTALQFSADSTYGDPNEGAGPMEITHEIWFRAPSHIKRPDIQRRHHMATRNYIALLYGLPIIGNDFYEMLSDLQNVTETYYELNEPSERWNSAQVIVQYLTQRKLDDIRGSLTNALGLLTWSEQPTVLWDAGYLEAFVHCVGMMTQQTMKTKEYRNLSQVTRHKLQMAYNGSQLRLIEAEERLARFDFPEMWYVDGVVANHPTSKSFENFREFLFAYYEGEFGAWPPKDEDHQGHWLSRAVMTRLQVDFGTLYNYWVDREIAWDANESRPSRKWEMVPKRLRAGGFEADGPGFPITDMLIGFDSSQKLDHIPHPYPLLPETKAPSPKLQSTRKNLLSKFRSKDKEVILDVKQQYQMALAFNQASNINRLGTTFEDNKLLDALSTYEKSATVTGTTASDSRLGRWILLYGILQSLSTISVDTAGLKYKDKLRYYIGPSLEGCPPWRSPEAAPLMIEASQQRSYCWTAPTAWTGAQSTTSPASPPGYSNHQYELTDPVSELDVGDNASSHRGASTPRVLPMRGSNMMSPSSFGSPLGSPISMMADDSKGGRGSVPNLPLTMPPPRNPRRISPGSAERGVDDWRRDAADEGPPQLGELPFTLGNL